MRTITTINIISTDIFEKHNILIYIKEKTFDYILDLKVGDKIAYNAQVLIHDNKYITCGIEGTIEEIVNFLDNQYINRTIAIKVDERLLNNIELRRKSIKDSYDKSLKEYINEKENIEFE